jgi:hypothetical protein
MKLTYWDEAKTKMVVELAEGETLGEFTGPGTFQATPNSAEWSAIEAMDPKPEIAPAAGAAAPADPAAASAAKTPPKAGDKPA